MNNYDTYLYGCADAVDEYISFFRYNDIIIKGIIDRNESLKKAAYETPYIARSDIMCKKKLIDEPNNSFVIIATRFFQGLEQMDIMECLNYAGISKFYWMYNDEKRQILSIWGQDNGGFGMVRYFREHEDQLRLTFDMLYDIKSKEIMLEYLRCFVESSYWRLPIEDGRNKYFFDGENTSLRKPIYRNLKDEVWINCEASIGDNVFLFFDNGLSARRIYAIEGDGEKYRTLIQHINLLPEKYRNKVKTVNKYIDDSLKLESYCEERITLINADIEGNELAMLKSMKNIIKRDRPVLAICVYHKRSDLVEIPQFLESIIDRYIYIIRKYDSSAFGPGRVGELVLYAVPEERNII